MSELVEKRIGNELAGEVISDSFKGYIFKITGGFDKDGFAMKNGILTAGRKRLMLGKGCKGLKVSRRNHRAGVKFRTLVRGAVVSHEIKILNLKIVQKGDQVIPNLTDEVVPKRLGPKRATKILKEYGLIDIYNQKKTHKDERKTLRFMITKFAGKREVTTKNGRTYTKRPKIQRLITPERLLRKRLVKKIKEDRVKITEENKKHYTAVVAELKKDSKLQKKNAKKTGKA